MVMIETKSKSMSKIDNEHWIKVDLHIHTLDDPKDVIDYSAHQLLERAKQLGFGVLAITLHDAVFDRAEVFADAAAMGILLIPAAEVRLQGADAILLNVTASEVAGLKNFEDLRQVPLRLTSPPASMVDLASAIYWIFLAHPFKLRRSQHRDRTPSRHSRGSSLESKSQT